MIRGQAGSRWEGGFPCWPGRLGPLVFLVSAPLWLAACGQAQEFRAPIGPYNSPSPSPQVIVASRGCGGGQPVAADALVYPRTELIRQGTDLQRVADDISGAVPGGDPTKDTGLALGDAQQVEQAVAASNLCAAVRDPLVSRLHALVVADQALVDSAAGGGTAAALDHSRAALQDLQTFLQ
jgi:hypothetical protein